MPEEPVYFSDLIFKIRQKCLQTEDTIRETTQLTLSEYKVLEVLRPQEKMRSAELAKKISLSPSRCSRIVEKMTTQNYIHTSPSLHDRRSISLKLTPLGEKIHTQINTLKCECDNKIAKRLSKEDGKMINEALHMLLNIL